MTVWFTSDTHFCHEKILKYDNLPFENIEERDETLIKNWNEKVGKKDKVYHLGDFAFANKKKTREIVFPRGLKLQSAATFSRFRSSAGVVLVSPATVALDRTPVERGRRGP